MRNQGAVRYEAEWILRQHRNADGEWNPDRDEYSYSHHATPQAAERAAIRGSREAGQCEWISVTEQKYEGFQWLDQRRWTGDWDGLQGDCAA